MDIGTQLKTKTRRLGGNVVAAFPGFRCAGTLVRSRLSAGSGAAGTSSDAKPGPRGGHPPPQGGVAGSAHPRPAVTLDVAAGLQDVLGGGVGPVPLRLHLQHRGPVVETMAAAAGVHGRLGDRGGISSTAGPLTSWVVFDPSPA